MSMRHEGYAGAQRAEDHANRVEPLWGRIAYVRALEAISRWGPRTEFTAVQLRRAIEERLTPPPDPRAYGNITRRLVKRGVIRDTGKRLREGSHGREVVVWEMRHP